MSKILNLRQERARRALYAAQRCLEAAVGERDNATADALLRACSKYAGLAHDTLRGAS